MLQTDKSIFCNCNQSLLRPFIHANHATLQKLEIKKLKTKNLCSCKDITRPEGKIAFNFD